MADEAFALSPISARAALPSEDDYAAISEAFMETSRGRWFLTEYAKRNRNADTRMVLDAVARIEQSLAAQKEESLQRDESLHREESLAAQQQAAAAAAAENRLSEALAAIRGAVEAAQESAIEALDSLALEQRLAPVRKGARVLREIAWRLREIGNDGRICDLIDSQVAVIEMGAEQISSNEARAALSAAFAALAGRLAELGHDDRAPATATEAAAPSSPAASQETPPSAVAETIETATQQASDAPFGSLAAPAAAALAEAEAVLAEAEPPPVVELTGKAVDDAHDAQAQDAYVEDSHAEDADAHDEAVLDMIAMEMGAPDPFDDDEIAGPVTEAASFADPAPLEPELAAVAPEPVTPLIEPPVQQAVQSPPQPVAQAEPAPSMEVSLGSTIIASGMLHKPAAANDPLAPIRRMTQAEKIAFFS
jgi:hypothetical protein